MGYRFFFSAEGVVSMPADQLLGLNPDWGCLGFVRFSRGSLYFTPAYPGLNP